MHSITIINIHHYHKYKYDEIRLNKIFTTITNKDFYFATITLDPTMLMYVPREFRDEKLCVHALNQCEKQKLSPTTMAEVRNYCPSKALDKLNIIR